MKQTCFGPAALLLASPAALPADQASEANILMIIAEYMGFSDAACCSGVIATPNRGAPPADGLRFTQFCNAARPWPSRA